MELDAILNEMLDKGSISKETSIKKEVIKESYKEEDEEDVDIEKVTDIEKIKIALDILYHIQNDYEGLEESIMILSDIIEENGSYCPYCGEEDCVCDEEDDEYEDEDEEDEDEEEED